MRFSVAVVLAVMVAVAAAQMVVVQQPAYDGLQPVQPLPAGSNLAPAKIVGVETYQGIPVLQNAANLQHPVILNAGVPQVVAAPVQPLAPIVAPEPKVHKHHKHLLRNLRAQQQRDQAIQQAINPFDTPVPVATAPVFPMEMQIPDVPVAPVAVGKVHHDGSMSVQVGVAPVPVQLTADAEHRIKQEINRLVELIAHADATKHKKQAKSLRRNLRRILRKLHINGLLPRTVETAADVARVHLESKKQRKAVKKAEAQKTINKLNASVKKAQDAVKVAKQQVASKTAPKVVVDVAVAHAKHAAARAEKALNRAEKKLRRKIAKKSKKIAKKQAKKDAKKRAKQLKKLATKALLPSAKAASKTLPTKVPSPKKVHVKKHKKVAAPVSADAAVKAAVDIIRAETKKALAHLKQELSGKIGHSSSAAFVNIGKKVEVLSKSALAFEAHFKRVDNKLKSDSAAILGLSSRVDGLATSNVQLQKAIEAVNKDIAAVTKKFKALDRKEKALSVAAKKAISTLAQRVKKSSSLVKKMGKSKSHFQQGVVASLAELDENVEHLDSMSI